MGGQQTNETISNHIEDLVAEEHRLAEGHAGRQLGADEQERLRAVRVELDRLWDLLRQRRAREEFDNDPDVVSIRDEGTVEGFQH